MGVWGKRRQICMLPIQISIYRTCPLKAPKLRRPPRLAQNRKQTSNSNFSLSITPILTPKPFFVPSGMKRYEQNEIFFQKPQFLKSKRQKFFISSDDFLSIQLNSKQKVVNEKVVAFCLYFRMCGRSPNLALPFSRYNPNKQHPKNRIIVINGLTR